MSDSAAPKNGITAYGWTLAAIVVLAFFLWEGRDGFNLWDEGFLWYGAQRVVAGEVPIRDFMAYDPLRYYWSAGWMILRQDLGIVAVRESAVLFQFLGLGVGLAAVGRALAGRDWGWRLLVAVTIAVWMFPRHKLFDASVALFLLWALVLWVERPSKARFLLAGVAVGGAACFGRNHGLYGALGSVGVMICLIRLPGIDWRQGPLWWVVGVVLGYLPVLLMLSGVPGFATAFWASIAFLFDLKATNLPLPVPWPWLDGPAHETPIATGRRMVVGAFFVGLLVYGVAGWAWLAWRRMRKQPLAPTTVASVALALPYAHFALSRADVGHLAQGAFPLVVGALAAGGAVRPWIKWPLGILFAASSFLVMLPEHPGWQRRVYDSWEQMTVGEDTLKMSPVAAADVALLDILTRDYAGGGGNFYAAPYWPGAYAVHGRRSPVWEIYALFPRGEDFENAEISRLRAANPAFVVILDFALDGREELRFANTHPLIHRYVIENFEPLPGYSTNPTCLVFRPRSTAR